MFCWIYTSSAEQNSENDWKINFNKPLTSPWEIFNDLMFTNISKASLVYFFFTIKLHRVLKETCSLKRKWMELNWNRYKKQLHCIGCISYDITYYWTSAFTVRQKVFGAFSEGVFYILPGHKTYSSFLV